MGPSSKSGKIPWLLILIFVLLVLVIGIAGQVFQKQMVNQHVRDQYQILSFIADSKARRIIEWRHQRLADAYLLYKKPPVI